MKMDMMNDNRRNHPNIVKSSLLMSFIVLVFLSTIILFSIIIMDVNEYNKDVRTYIFNTQSEIVLTIKNELENNIDRSLHGLSQKMEEDIMNLDLVSLEENLNNGIIPDELRDIFDKYYDNVYLTGIENDNNDIFICNSKGIIYDKNLQYAAEDGQERTWEFEINNQYNKQMAEETVKKLLDKNTDESFLVFERKNKYNHYKYDTLDESTIEKIMFEEGLQGLKNYTFLLPIYITENGDIFGKDDIIDGHIQKNNKFIIVQEYSLYDYIIKNHSMDEYVDITTIEKDYVRIDTLLKVFAISDIVAILCTILFSASLSNNLYDSNEKNAQLTEEKENNE